MVRVLAKQVQHYNFRSTPFRHSAPCRSVNYFAAFYFQFLGLLSDLLFFFSDGLIPADLLLLPLGTTPFYIYPIWAKNGQPDGD